MKRSEVVRKKLAEFYIVACYKNNVVFRDMIKHRSSTGNPFYCICAVKNFVNKEYMGAIFLTSGDQTPQCFDFGKVVAFTDL